MIIEGRQKFDGVTMLGRDADRPVHGTPTYDESPRPDPSREHTVNTPNVRPPSGSQVYRDDRNSDGGGYTTEQPWDKPWDPDESPW